MEDFAKYAGNRITLIRKRTDGSCWIFELAQPSCTRQFLRWNLTEGTVIIGGFPIYSGLGARRREQDDPLDRVAKQNSARQ